MRFGYFYIDQYYLMLVVPALLLSIYAQIKVKSTFSRYRGVRNSKNMTGAEVARYLLEKNEIHDVQVVRTAGDLTDHYDPKRKVLRLSDSVFASTSVSAIGVAAHETGHAIQHKVKYGPLKLRSSLVPVANIGSAAGPYIALIGLFMYSELITNIGLILFAGAVLFYLITLPVEFNASNRAIACLDSSGILLKDELKSSRKVLNAAAMTYVASALVAVASFLRLFLIARDRQGRN